MKYQLRHFENNMQMVASVGWIFVILGIIMVFVDSLALTGSIILIVIGAFLIWIQLRGKRITVDTNAKEVISGKEKTPIIHPSLVYMNEVRVSQNVNSRGSSANVKMYFYKAYIQDGENAILVSCNRNDQRDMNALKKIATDLQVPFQLNYK